jgi:hypothetical protein
LPADVEGYREYVAARMDGLRRTAYLLCGDWHTADDLVSTALVKLFRHWRRVSMMDNPDAYVRRTLLRGSGAPLLLRPVGRRDGARTRLSARHRQEPGRPGNRGVARTPRPPGRRRGGNQKWMIYQP